MPRLLGRLASRCAGHPLLTVVCWLLFALVAVGSAYTLAPTYASRTGLPGTESQAAADRIAAAFPAGTSPAATVVTTATGGRVLTDPRPQAALHRLERTVAALPHVDPAAIHQSALSPDRRAALVTVAYRAGWKPGADDLDRLRAAVASTGRGLRATVSGQLPRDQATAAIGGPEKAGFVVVVIVLLIAFGSAVSALIPVVTGAVGLIAGLGLVRLLALVYPVDSAAPALASMIGLGVGIDYALFIVTRHREELDHGHPPLDAASNATAAAGSSVLYAGVTVVAAILGLAAAGVPLITSLGLAAALVVVVAVLAAITLVPALLALAGRRVDALRIPVLSHHLPLEADRVDRPVPHWRRWAGHIERHALPYTVGFGVLLLVLAIPAWTIRLGEPDDGVLPPDTGLRQAYDTVTRHFGVGRNAPLQVVVQTRAGDPIGDARLRTVTALARGGSDVSTVLPPRLSRHRDTAVLTVVPRTAPQDAATTALVERLRGQAPRVARHLHLRLQVTGQPAGALDFANRVKARLPLFVAIVLAVSFVLLMLVFRSLLVPLKAVVLNVLSIAAAYGIVTAAFQWGWLTGLLGLSGPMPIVEVVPMMMFAIVFGLSMDYEVFLLSRIREDWLATRDARGSVVSGISTTARVISSAGAIMVCVFVAFTFSPATVVKMMGLGLAAAVLIDATVIRLILVPGMMVLFGRNNWWLPRWLDRRLPDIHLEL